MKVKERREICGIGQKHLATLMGVTQTAIAKWETGVAYPSADKLPTLADALGCTIDELYGRQQPTADALPCDKAG